LSNGSQTDGLTVEILKVINEKNPQSVDELVDMLKDTTDLQEKQILDLVIKLQAEGVIKLEESNKTPSRTLKGSFWYLLTILVGLVTVASVYVISPGDYPLAYVRNVFGLFFIFFMPGYAFVKAFFPLPTGIGVQTNLEFIERTTLSVGMSIAISAIIGLSLYFLPTQLDLSAVVVALFLFTAIFATIGLLRRNVVSTPELLNE
jgi:hypothetical protein